MKLFRGEAGALTDELVDAYRTVSKTLDEANAHRMTTGRDGEDPERIERTEEEEIAAQIVANVQDWLSLPEIIIFSDDPKNNVKEWETRLAEPLKVRARGLHFRWEYQGLTFEKTYDKGLSYEFMPGAKAVEVLHQRIDRARGAMDAIANDDTRDQMRGLLVKFDERLTAAKAARDKFAEAAARRRALAAGASQHTSNSYLAAVQDDEHDVETVMMKFVIYTDDADTAHHAAQDVAGRLAAQLEGRATGVNVTQQLDAPPIRSALIEPAEEQEIRPYFDAVAYVRCPADAPLMFDDADVGTMITISGEPVRVDGDLVRSVEQRRQLARIR